MTKDAKGHGSEKGRSKSSDFEKVRHGLMSQGDYNKHWNPKKDGLKGPGHLYGSLVKSTTKNQKY